MAEINMKLSIETEGAIKKLEEFNRALNPVHRIEIMFRLVIVNLILMGGVIAWIILNLI